MSVAVGAMLVAAGCAGAPSTPADQSAASGTYAAFTTILQAGEDAAPELCLGGVMESYPPQCGGPEVIGLDWDDVADAETASGVTWGTGWVVGSYDADTESFTLTEPVSEEPPDGVEVRDELDHVDFPPLCDDPYRGGEESFDASTTEAMDAQNELTERAAALEGYITLYVSDGSSEFNVLVQGDAEAAHAQLREVWQGWLCVATGSGAAEADVLAAQEALHAELGELVLGSGGGGTEGIFDVTVIIADEATTQAVLAAVEPWLSADQVRVSGILQPVS